MKLGKFTEFMQEKGQALIYLVFTALILLGVAYSCLKDILN